MRQFVRSALWSLLIVAAATIVGAQTPPGGAQPGSAPTPKAATPPPRPALFNQVVATVNGEPITRGELVQFLSHYPPPPGDQQEVYEYGLNSLANFKLVNQYLDAKNIPVTEPDIDEEYNRFEKALRENGQDPATALAQNGLAQPDVRKEMRKTVRWRKYVKAVATDQALKKFVEDNKDAFNKVLVRASHIVIQVAPDAPAADKEKARQKLVAIKREIDSNQISFADAANKYSEDDANKTSPSGGDLGYFLRKDKFNEQFSAAAFSLKKGSTSDPIETPYGYHLIQVTDRKEGQPFDFEQNRIAVEQAYASDLQERIVALQRKTAKIEIKPMPTDLFGPPPTAAPPGGAATPKGAAPAPPAQPR